MRAHFVCGVVSVGGGEWRGLRGGGGGGGGRDGGGSSSGSGSVVCGGVSVSVAGVVERASRAARLLPPLMIYLTSALNTPTPVLPAHARLALTSSVQLSSSAQVTQR